MAKAEMDMIRDILGWPVSDEQKLALVRHVVGEKVAPAPAPAKRVGRPKKSAKATATASVQTPAKVVKRRKRSALRAEGSGYTRRSQLWAELKRLAPDKAAKLSYTKVSTKQLEPMVEEAKKAK